MQEYREKAGDVSPNADGSPQKRKGKQSAATPKRSRKGTSAATSVGVEIEAKIAAAAEQEGLLTSLKNLVTRPEIIAKGTDHMDALSALKQTKGLVNKAKEALLGGA